MHGTGEFAGDLNRRRFAFLTICLRLFGRDADLVVMVDCQIPADDLVVHFL